MKILTRIILISLLCLPTINATAQSGYYGKQWFFSTIDGIPTEHQVQTTLATKTPDLGGKSRPILFEGNPTKEIVHETFFKYVESGQGQFFKTVKSNDKISFFIDYGYTTDGDKRIFFDSIVASSGDIGNETNIEKLQRNDISYDCNIFDQNCFVIQRYY